MTNILKLFMPKEEKFFLLLEKQSRVVLKGAKEFKELIDNYSKLSEKERSFRAGRIKEIESAGDNVTHEIIGKLNKSFITPFDKEDIHEITESLDDVLDLINATAKRLILFRINNITEYIKEFADVILRGVMEIDKCICSLKTLKNINVYRINIHSIENEGDELFGKALANLFENNKQNKQIIDVVKYKEIYQFLEDITDKCEHIADVIEGIVVKHD